MAKAESAHRASGGEARPTTGHTGDGMGLSKHDVRCWINLLVVGGLASFVAGCGGVDGVEINAFGMSTDDIVGKRKEQKVAERSPLVVPPSNQLPAPGSGQQVAKVDPSWPVDSDQRQAAQKAEIDALVKQYCSDAEWLKKTKPNEFNRVTQDGRLCKSALAKYLTDSVNSTAPAE